MPLPHLYLHLLIYEIIYYYYIITKILKEFIRMKRTSSQDCNRKNFKKECLSISTSEIPVYKNIYFLIYFLYKTIFLDIRIYFVIFLCVLFNLNQKRKFWKYLHFKMSKVFLCEYIFIFFLFYLHYIYFIPLYVFVYLFLLGGILLLVYITRIKQIICTVNTRDHADTPFFILKTIE